MNVRLNIDDAFLRAIQRKVGDASRVADLVRDAFTILNWAVDEAANGRVVLSASRRGDDLHRLVMPTLSRIEARARNAAQG